MSKRPAIRIIIGYEEIFRKPPNKNRIDFLSNISRTHLLYELCGLNYRLKPKAKPLPDDSIERQFKELEYFCKDAELFDHCKNTMLEYSVGKDYSNIFSRSSCLFAIEEIINSEEIVEIPDFKMNNLEVWNSIFFYILCVNNELTKVSNEKAENLIGFERLNPLLIPIGELVIPTYPLITLHRGYRFIEYLLSLDQYNVEFTNYIEETYSVTPLNFIKILLVVTFGNSNRENPNYEFEYIINEEQHEMFNKLSEHFPNKDTIKLLSIRKSPFIKISEDKFILVDISFLIQKGYSQLINDFWFDWLKHQKDEEGVLKYNFKNYRGKIGYFFENYIGRILKNSLSKYKHSRLLLFDELEANIGGLRQELGDFYFRYGNRIIIGEVKSGSVYDKEKYDGDIDVLYKNDRNKFFDDFGVSQVVSFISNIDENISSLDNSYPSGHAIQIFPVIIVNDNALQTPLMPHIFSMRFKEIIDDYKYNKKKVTIHPLSLIHVDDLEWMEDKLIKNPKEIWEILKFHHRNKKLVLPFYHTVYQVIKQRGYPTGLHETLRNLIMS